MVVVIILVVIDDDVVVVGKDLLQWMMDHCGAKARMRSDPG